MTLELEQHLMEMGVIPSTPLEAIASVSNSRQDHLMRLAKGFYDDPRDPITGEVPF